MVDQQWVPHLVIQSQGKGWYCSVKSVNGVVRLMITVLIHQEICQLQQKLTL